MLRRHRSPITRANHLNPIFDLVFVQGSSQFILISASSEAVYLWDVARFAQTGPLRISSSQRFINSLAVNRTGRLLATVGSDAAVRLWDITNVGKRARPVPYHLECGPNRGRDLQPHQQHPVCGRFQRVLFACGIFLVFTLTLAWPMRLLNGHQSLVLEQAVSANGHWLASATADGERPVATTNDECIDVDLDYAGLTLAQACQMVGRNLSQAEWAIICPTNRINPPVPICPRILVKH